MPLPEHHEQLPPSVEQAVWEFCLYIAGGAPHAARASDNLASLLEEYLPGRYQVEKVDVLEEPYRALHDGIIVTPTLVKLQPLPVCRVIGDLADRNKVLLVLGLEGEGS